MRRLPALVWILVACFVVPATAFAVTALRSVGGFNWDFTDSSDFAGAAGAMIDGTSDAYDTCYYLNVGGTRYNPAGLPTTTLAGRQLEWGVQSMSGLNVSRIAYVPSADHNYARYLDVLANPGAAPVTVTVTIDGNLGSDGGTVVNTTSSGDTSFTTADEWMATDDFDGGGDPSLAHVVQGTSPTVRTSAASISGDNISYSWMVTVPAGGRVAIMHFAIQEMTQALAQAEARRLVEAPDDALVGIEAYYPDIINFPVLFPCTGVDGSACTTPSGTSGLCYGMTCCTGCWDGTRCRSGTVASHCGIRGGACASCVDTNTCTNDVCTAGVCSNPNSASGTACDDGRFCTATDTCNGSGTCNGTGARCNDFEACTTDTCMETTDTCVNAPRPDSTTCTVGTLSGFCRVGACCVGCWDGASCQSGFGATACGGGGGTCTSCVDGDLCTSDVCTAGRCSNPDAPARTPCNDGQFCTATDTCDGSGVCNGTGTRCDDGATCTMDSCDEAADRCVYVPDPGQCAIGGACVAAGTANPSYPCLVCDPTVSGTDWSPLPVGMECDLPTCSGGRLTTRTCDAMGFCAANVPTECPSGRCATRRECEAPCVAGMCPAGQYCDMLEMVCLPLGENGAECNAGAGCTSGFCVDGVCCEGECGGTCERCTELTGTCDPIGRGLDPEDECTLECDGERACVIPDDAGVDAGGASDGGATGSDASTTRDAGTAPPPEDDGCGCRSSGESGWSFLGLLGLALVAIRRRRR